MMESVSLKMIPIDPETGEASGGESIVTVDRDMIPEGLKIGDVLEIEVGGEILCGKVTAAQPFEITNLDAE